MSRRAVLSFQQEQAEALRPDSLDTACATVLQFFLREGKVHAVAYMRSNDAIWGLPYDVFLFTMMQEMLAVEMEVEVGTYSHVAGSFHIYARHFNLARRISGGNDPALYAMPPMIDLGRLPDFLRGEQLIRAEGPSERLPAVPGFWGDLLDVLRIFSLHRDGTSAPEVLSHSPYRPVLSPFLQRHDMPA